MTSIDRKEQRREFERVAMKYFTVLSRTANWMAQDATEAEDLLQETYLKAYQAFHRFQGTDCKAWLFQILRNTFTNSRHKRKELTNTISFQSTECLPSRGEAHGRNFLPASACSTGVSQLRTEEVTQALNSLPVRQRRVVILAYLEGFSQREIAHMLDCPVGTVMTLSYRGRKRLRDLLSDYAPSRTT